MEVKRAFKIVILAAAVMETTAYGVLYFNKDKEKKGYVQSRLESKKE